MIKCNRGVARERILHPGLFQIQPCNSSNIEEKVCARDGEELKTIFSSMHASSNSESLPGIFSTIHIHLDEVKFRS